MKKTNGYYTRIEPPGDMPRACKTAIGFKILLGGVLFILYSILLLYIGGSH